MSKRDNRVPRDRDAFKTSKRPVFADLKARLLDPSNVIGASEEVRDQLFHFVRDGLPDTPDRHADLEELRWYLEAIEQELESLREGITEDDVGSGDALHLCRLAFTAGAAWQRLAYYVLEPAAAVGVTWLDAAREGGRRRKLSDEEVERRRRLQQLVEEEMEREDVTFTVAAERVAQRELGKTGRTLRKFVRHPRKRRC